MLRQQVSLLHDLGETYDNGHPAMGLPLAVAIRVLVHDTARSHALLQLLGELTQMVFIDTSLPINPNNLMPNHTGLVLTKVTVGTGIEWVPRLDTPSFTTLRETTFAEWWRTDLMKSGSGALWSRHSIVTDVANKEGGAHVDPDQPLDIQAIEDQNSMGMTYYDPFLGNEITMQQGPMLPSVRQIAYELETSIYNHFGSQLS